MATAAKKAKVRARPASGLPQQSLGLPAPDVRNLRQDFGLTRKSLARMTGLSERTLASWETGGKLNDTGQRAIIALERFLRALTELVRKDAIAGWLEKPNEAFSGLKPVEVLERGEADRLWRMIYHLGSGAAC